MTTSLYPGHFQLTPTVSHIHVSGDTVTEQYTKIVQAERPYIMNEELKTKPSSSGSLHFP